MKITIEKAGPEWLESIVSFQVQMALETENLMLDTETVSKGAAHIFANPQAGHYRVALHNNQPIASLLVLYEWSEWRNGNVIWVHSVYVLPEFRSQGVFKAMYAQLKEEVQSNASLKGIRLYVDKTNKGAQKVYEQLGMNNQHYELYEWVPEVD